MTWPPKNPIADKQEREQMEFVTWDQITAECDGYRAGFVAVFRKYEGQPTNEKDDQGRTVKVAATNFAVHVGIPGSTFRRWVREQGGRAGHAAQGSARSGQIGRQVAKNPNVSVDDKVGMMIDLASDPQVMRAYREQRAPDVTPAAAKAASALAKAITDPIARSAAKVQVPMWIDQLKTMAEVLAEYEFDEDEITKLKRPARKVMDEIEVQEFRLGMVEADR